jgi:hypothetical protein
MTTQRLLMALTLVGLVGAQAYADEPACPVARVEVYRGLQVRSALGSSFWLGNVGKTSSPGFAISFGVGYEFFSWLALEASWSSNINETQQKVPPAQGHFNTQTLNLGPRLSLPIKAFDLFLRGGAGWMWSAPNILVRTEGYDTQRHWSWMGGLGFFYHTPRRRVWLGIEGNVFAPIENMKSFMIQATAVLGVTLL